MEIFEKKKKQMKRKLLALKMAYIIEKCVILLFISAYNFRSTDWENVEHNRTTGRG